MNKHFSIDEAIRFGWSKVKHHSGLVFQLVLALFALEVATAIVNKVLEGTVLGSAASFVLTVVSTFVGTGVMYITLKLARGEHAQFNQILPPWQLVWKYFCSGVLVGIVCMLPILIAGILGLILVSAYMPHLLSSLATSPMPGDVMKAAFDQLQGIPGVFAALSLLAAVAFVTAMYLALRYSMARFAIVDGADIVESIRQSAKLTHGVKWQLLAFVAALVLLNLLGMLALLVGLLITTPISMLAMAHVYLKLKARHS